MRKMNSKLVLRIIQTRACDYCVLTATLLVLQPSVVEMITKTDRFCVIAQIITITV